MGSDVRDRILQATAQLLVTSGSEGISTRAVATAAGVQAPTLYRLFGDKQGLIDAVVAYGYERYLAEKKGQPATDDPVADLRRGWDLHVEFGITHPAFYPLMVAPVRPEEHSPHAEAHAMLLDILQRVAQAGLLLVPAQLAGQMVRAACVGVTLTAIEAPQAAAANRLSDRVREAVLAAVIAPSPSASPAGDQPAIAARAIALDAALPMSPPQLTTAEVGLLRQWLARLAEH